MKNLKILILTGFIIIPKTIFGIVGFGLNVIQDGTKMEGAENTETSGLSSAIVKSYEMESLPVGAGGYIFIDLAGWAIELEANVVGGEYDFEFIQNINGGEGFSLPKTSFGWARGTTAITIKKNVADFSIPLLAKTALSVGVGTSSHKSTPRASVSMVKELIGDDLINADASQLEDKLITYLEDNLIEGSGLHAQLGLRFKILVIDTHLNFRYNIAENVYDGSNGYTEIQFKLGMGF